MTNSTVTIRRLADGMWCVGPDVPLPAAAGSGADEMLLEVFGGLLVWDVLASEQLPVALIDDVELAQEWVWAIFGEPVALALDAARAADPGTGPVPEVSAAPALPALAVSARRLAYAHWAARWWPASTLDGIAALDPTLLDRDIALLTEECESLVDGADAIVPRTPAAVETPPRASDYALAAGDEHRAGALVLARGTGGWDWRRCPPGVVDASESAVSWQLVREAGATVVSITVAAHPDLPDGIPEHLRPRAHIDTGQGELDIELSAAGDAWIGESSLSTMASAVRIAIHVPGFGPVPDPSALTGESGPLTEDPAPTADSPAGAQRQRIRDFAASRLRRATTSASDDGPFAPLLAEVAAAAGDSDF